MKQKLLDIGERIFWTFVTTYATLILTSGISDMTGQKAAAAAALAAAGALAWNLIAQLIGVQNGKTWWQDALFRAFTTFLQTAGAILIVNGSLDWTQWKAASLAGITAVVTLLKGVALAHVGDPSTAGIFATTKDTTSGAYQPQHAADDPAPADDPNAVVPVAPDPQLDQPG